MITVPYSMRIKCVVELGKKTNNTALPATMDQRTVLAS